MPLNPGCSEPELVYFLRDSFAKLLIADDTQARGMGRVLQQAKTLQRIVAVDSSSLDAFAAGAGGAPACSIAPDETALMLYTSGTTGRPKAAELSHANLTAMLNMLEEAWEWREDDILLHVLPVFHVHGLLVALQSAIHAGASTIMLQRFDPAGTLDALRRSGCTVFMGVPTIHSRLAAAATRSNAVDLSRLRLVTSGSARMSEELFRQFSDCFGYEPVERYGMTETGIMLSNPLRGQRRPGWVGLPLPGVELRVVDPANNAPLADGEVGEIQTRGPHVFKGYWNDAQKTAAAFSEDGWFKTGDLGLRGADGYFQLRGRSADLVISGGMNVYPLEVERVLDSHPAIAQSAVIGCPDAEWGEAVTAVLTATDEPPREEELLAYCRRRLASYKIPKRMVFVQEFPRNAMGKVSKPALRQEHCRECR